MRLAIVALVIGLLACNVLAKTIYVGPQENEHKYAEKTVKPENLQDAKDMSGQNLEDMAFVIASNNNNYNEADEHDDEHEDNNNIPRLID